MSVLIVSRDGYCPEIVDAKAVLYSLGADLVRHQVVHERGLVDPENLQTHDCVVVLEDKLKKEEVEVYQRYCKEKERPLIVSKSDTSCLFGDFCRFLGIDFSCPDNCPVKKMKRRKRC